MKSLLLASFSNLRDGPTSMRCHGHLVSFGAFFVLLQGALCMGSLAQAQPTDVHFERIGSEAGLSHNTVNAIIEDRDGFLWIATDDGLDRYDGYAFVVYRLEASGETLETSNTFRALLEDAAGHLWAGADQGLYRLERATGRFLTYPLPRENARGPRGVSTLFEDRRGTVWVGAGNELFFYEADRDDFAALPLDHEPSEGPEARFMAIQQDAEGMIWALLMEGRPFRLSLYQIDPVTLASQRHELSREQTSDALLIDREGRFWIHPTNQGVVAPEDLLFPRSESAPRVSYIESIIQDDEGAIWFATEAGLYRRDPATQALSLHLPDPTQSNWQRNYLRGLHLDASGILWMGSLDGLLRYDPHVKRFRRLRHDAQNPVSLSSDPVSAIVAGPDGNLWVSTFGGGLNRLDLATKAVERFRHDDRRPGSLCDDNLWDLTWSRDGLLWIATNSGLCVYDPRQGRFSRVAVPGLGQESGLYGVKTVDEHPDGTLWLGTNQGIFRYDPRQGSTRYYGYEKEGGGLRSRTVMSLVVEDAQTVWMGSSLGDLHRLDVEKEGIDAFPLRTTDGRAAGEVEIYDLHLGRQGTLWLATSAGLGRFNLADESFEFPIAAEELPGSVVYSILEDDRGGLWLGTNQGLSHFDPERPTGERVRTFTLSDGVGNVEFNRHAAFKHEDGTLFFGGMTGLTFFHDDDIRDNAYVPPVVLTRIQASNRDDTETINPFGLDQLVLSYRDYFFSFEFTALNFTNPERNQYAYQLEGFDEDWVEAGSRRFASYTNIPPGNYVFRVKGSNNDGVWNEDGTSLRVTITPPWWGTWWFRLLALAAVAGLLAAAYRYRVGRLLERERLHQTEEEARRLAELDAAKSRFFANISHEFRTPLTLILGTLDQIEDAAAPKQPVQRIRRNAHRLLGLID
ncbi:MAG: two-component regulator propeller domain-containing protein, partial [Rhodothermales bacterium]